MSFEFPNGHAWKSWMRDFRFGTLAFMPDGDLNSFSDSMRRRFDPESAHTCGPHITVTQPFTAAPSDADLKKVEDLIFSN